MNLPIRLSALAMLVALAGCGRDDAPAEGERRTAAGEVLGGTITDDMLPLDTVRSQSPSMASADGADDGEADEAAASSDATRPAASAGPVPAASPSPAPVETPEAGENATDTEG
ncbi:hypothetical protein GRI40_11380 [Altererythrobacter aerius]|uniref:Argininosuccinate lyase n=1 Tax=Tsuneonella aeria TaxID=1837929 RepID=A0A6I4TGR4_9SPHN|nr:hypothetical protein [Tsuneonella aeria]MXO75817.1 hypothetical protein [Tsuneonella aeria]